MKTKKSKNIFLVILSSLLITIMCISVVMFAESSDITVNSIDGTYEYSQFVPYPLRNKVGFEDSSLFRSILLSDIDDVTRLAVIRSQLETKGKYDGTKKIDIAKYASRNKSLHDVETPEVFFYLDDLIKWGNYGIEFKGDKLVNRYKTTDHKTLIEHCEEYEEFEALADYLVISAEDLFANYTEYMDLKDVYADINSNIMYCYQFMIDGKEVRITNMDSSIASMNNDQISGLITSHNKYVCFNPEKMQVATNVYGIDSVTMKRIIGPYDYIFGDGSRIWIAVDESFSAVDTMSIARESYTKADTVFPVVCTTFFGSLALLILLVVVMTIRAGKIYFEDEEGNVEQGLYVTRFDELPIELYIAIGAVLLLISLVCIVTVPEIYLSYRGNGLKMIYIYIITGIASLVLSLLAFPVYLVFVRKIKSHFCWNGSLTKRFIVDIYDNKSIVIRTWLPYLIFLFFNLVMVLLSNVTLVIAAVVDIAIGFVLYKNSKVREGIIDDIDAISAGKLDTQVDLTGLHGANLTLGEAVNHIGTGLKHAVETSMRDEKMKADLITNVSHDIKTPLTSIINYVDLIKRENIPNEKVRGYVDILEQKSQRLKALTDDLVEASKISSGAMVLNIETINIKELINQSMGEFEDKFQEKGLTFVSSMPEEAVSIKADARGLFRVIENLYNNIYKYALENTRVYVDITKTDKSVTLSIKNISSQPLNISAKELMERFVQGDASRRTEGSGLGLSIAKSLTEAMGGEFDLSLDGDLFKVVLDFNS